MKNTTKESFEYLGQDLERRFSIAVRTDANSTLLRKAAVEFANHSYLEIDSNDIVWKLALLSRTNEYLTGYMNERSLFADDELD